MRELLYIAAGWLTFFGIHSLLAARTVKQKVARRWPAAAPFYRLAFNLIALLSLALPLWLVDRYSQPPLWAWTGAWAAVSGSLTFLSLIGFAWSLRYYDMGVFLGFRQWRERLRDPDEAGPLCLSPLHRCVRHPWYSLALLLIWTRDFDPAWLASAVLITGYFIVGSQLEERKLLLQYGDAYRRYRERVPPFLPWFGRTLGSAEARELESGADGSSPTV